MISQISISFIPAKNSSHGARPFRALFVCSRYASPMSSTTTNLWGQDIALDANGQVKVAANGELVLTEGVDTGVQDIVLRIFTRLGGLFYDTEFGSLVHDWIAEDSTAASRAALEAEIIMRVELDPRVVVGSVRYRGREKD